MAKKTKRVVCISDLHSGHRAGLTPTAWQWSEQGRGRTYEKFGTIQRECWRKYRKLVSKLSPVDVLVVNGDAIHGRGERSGGVELITADRNDQVEMAATAVDMWKAPTVVIVRGTPYHAGKSESWEDVLWKEISTEKDNKKIGNHEWIEVNGVVFDFKHKVGSSQIPHGRHTAPSREAMWAGIWSEAGLTPKADWVVRSHVHYCGWSGQFRGDREVTAVTTPALQAMGSLYGAQQCSGVVDWGLMHWDIEPNGRTTWEKHVTTIQSQQASALKV